MVANNNNEIPTVGRLIIKLFAKLPWCARALRKLQLVCSQQCRQDASFPQQTLPTQLVQLACLSQHVCISCLRWSTSCPCLYADWATPSWWRRQEQNREGSNILTMTVCVKKHKLLCCDVVVIIKKQVNTRHREFLSKIAAKTERRRSVPLLLLSLFVPSLFHQSNSGPHGSTQGQLGAQVTQSSISYAAVQTQVQKKASWFVKVSFELNVLAAEIPKISHLQFHLLVLLVVGVILDNKVNLCCAENLQHVSVVVVGSQKVLEEPGTDFSWGIFAGIQQAQHRHRGLIGKGSRCWHCCWSSWWH